jgi:hypothetical protein
MRLETGRNSILNWLWRDIVDTETAKKAAREGFWAAVIGAVLNTVIALLSLAGIRLFNADIWFLIDTVIIGIIALGIYRMSRIAAVAGLANYIIAQIFLWIDTGPSSIVVLIIFAKMFLNSIRGTFAYHKYRKEKNKEGVKENIPPEATKRKILNWRALKALVIIALVISLVNIVRHLGLGQYGIPYYLLLILSFGMYGIAGYLTAREGGSGAVGGGIIALVDSAVTLAITGPQDSEIESQLAKMTIWLIGGLIFTIPLGLGLGWFGGWIWHRRQRAVESAEQEKTPTPNLLRDTKTENELGNGLKQKREGIFPISKKWKIIIGVGLVLILALGGGIFYGFRTLVNQISHLDVIVEDLVTGNITTIASGGQYFSPTFSPDGSRVLFVQNEEDHFQINTYSLQERSISVLIEDGIRRFDPTWGPFGQTILYSSEQSGQRDLWLYSLEDKRMTQLTQDKALEFDPKLSPDGKWVLFLQEGENGKDELFIMPLERGAKIQLTKTRNFLHKIELPTWAPNSQEIAFISFLSLIIVNTEGNIVKEVDLTSLANITQLLFLPTDPDILILKARDPDGGAFSFNIYKINRHSGKIELWKEGRRFLEFDYDINPDGRLLTYIVPEAKGK